MEDDAADIVAQSLPRHMFTDVSTHNVRATDHVCNRGRSPSILPEDVTEEAIPRTAKVFNVRCVLVLVEMPSRYVVAYAGPFKRLHRLNFSTATHVRGFRATAEA